MKFEIVPARGLGHHSRRERINSAVARRAPGLCQTQGKNKDRASRKERADGREMLFSFRQNRWRIDKALGEHSWPQSIDKSAVRPTPHDVQRTTLADRFFGELNELPRRIDVAVER